MSSKKRKDESEVQFQNRVIAKLKSYGPCVWHTKISQRSKAGDLDLHICVLGEFLAWELKKETGVASELQKYTVGKMRESGAKARFVRPSTFDEAFRELEFILKERMR